MNTLIFALIQSHNVFLLRKSQFKLFILRTNLSIHNNGKLLIKMGQYYFQINSFCTKYAALFCNLIFLLSNSNCYQLQPQSHKYYKWTNFLSRPVVDTWRRSNTDTTSHDTERRCIDVETTSCVYRAWATKFFCYIYWSYQK